MSSAAYTVLEKLNEQQVRELHALYQDEWWTRGRSLDDVRRVLDGSDYVFALCASQGGELAAFARVLTDGVFKALLFDVIVAPAFRSAGLGRVLMDHIVNHSILRQVRHLELYCLPEMIPFYEKWGFSTDVSGVSFMRRKNG